MSLTRLASLFGDTPLYIVGGAVRNMLLHVEPKDIDITSSKRAEDVMRLLEGTEYEVVPSSLRMGTIIIKDGVNRYEYTSFRTDSYPINSGAHRPCEVRFTEDIEEDARRRDFTCNAVYYDILRDSYVDPLHGIEDIEKRILRTTREPEEVFQEDGLRIMRLVRFYAELGFEIDCHALEVASSLVSLLRDISIERIEEELTKILLADTNVYGNKSGHIEGVKLLIDMGAMQYIIPELLDGKGVMQNPLYHDDDVLSHVLRAFEISDPSIRLATLLHDIGKPKDQQEHGNMHMHNVIGSEMARDILTRLRYPTRVIQDVSTLVYIHMFDINNQAKDNTIKKFIIDYHDYMDEFLMLRYADSMASKGDLTSYYHIKDIYDRMLSDGVPMTLRELAINGKDILDMGMQGEIVGKILSELLYNIAYGEVDNNREELIRYVRGRRWNS